MRAFGSTHTGGGGADLGAIAAGLAPVAGVEYDAAIAEVGRRNIGDHIQVARAEDVDYGAWPTLFWLHSSPSCKTASQANNDGGEGPADLSSAAAIVRAIETIRPRRFSLENVWQYRTYQSFANILAALHTQGYAVNFWHLNSADYGVPQTRKRLILVASLDHTPRKPLATHQDPARIVAGQASMLAQLPPWCGWYGAVADIIHTFEPTEPAPWQVARLPAELCETLLIHPTEQRTFPTRDGEAPSFTVTCANGFTPRAFIVGRTSDMPIRDRHEPALTVMASLKSQTVRAYIVDGTHRTGANLTVKDTDEPCFTVVATAQRRPGSAPMAYIIDGQNANPRDKITIRGANEPVFTVTNPAKAYSRASVGGYWVKVSVRGSARFQSFDDDYQLPASNGLAGMVVGNAVPPLLAQAWIEANL